MAYRVLPPTLVLVGSWNPAILQPKWIARELFDKDGENVEVRMEFNPTPGLPPRFTLFDITFIPTNNRLTIHPQDVNDASLTQVEELGRRTLEKLSHTPITAFGQNLEIIEEEPSDELLNSIRVQDEPIDRINVPDAHWVGSRSVTALEMGPCILNLERQLDTSGAAKIKFNFHYNVDGASDAQHKLRGTMTNNMDIALDILNTYNIRIREEMEEQE